MSRAFKELHGATLHAMDGEIGRVDETVFDDEHWTVRYLVVNTSSWNLAREVLISPMSLLPSHWDWQRLDVNLTREDTLFRGGHVRLVAGEEGPAASRLDQRSELAGQSRDAYCHARSDPQRAGVGFSSADQPRR